MKRPDLRTLVGLLRGAPSWQRKHEIKILSELPQPVINGTPVPLGDDTAAIPMDNGFLLFAAEAILPALVEADPYLAGRSAILANVNDIYAMGGIPMAVVDTLISRDLETASEVIRGLHDAATRYNVAIVGGHLTSEADQTSLSVSIIGKADNLLRSSNAKRSDDLLLVTGLTGKMHPDFPFWNCSAHLPSETLLEQLGLLPIVANHGWCDAARDVSMAGMIGTTLMMLETSNRLGATIDLGAIPTPDIDESRYVDWLMSFPSYGFILAARPTYVEPMTDLFEAHGLSCTRIGATDDSGRVTLTSGTEREVVWDFTTESFMGFSAPSTSQTA